MTRGIARILPKSAQTRTELARTRQHVGRTRPEVGQIRPTAFRNQTNLELRPNRGHPRMRNDKYLGKLIGQCIARLLPEVMVEYRAFRFGARVLRRPVRRRAIRRACSSAAFLRHPSHALGGSFSAQLGEVPRASKDGLLSRSRVGSSRVLRGLWDVVPEIGNARC